MAYTPQVEEATLVSENKNNGLFEILVVLKDRTHCRLIFERTPDGAPLITHANRLNKAPCPVCRKDFLCNCMERYSTQLAEQALAKVELSQ
ncbi:hypothetical protein ABNB59_02830 [Paenibacillus larvae]|uniref:Uncharacterized protein n=4 Tax=Paenibacillus larvae TaxID=1464 RepID=V9W248_9BACL|nr:hypothetical protein [Paenibacillus larvae]AHD05081.1 hypothetical protein ERIC2_c12500 [Paenibacillus larvae subsp. larvae DSM 25430]AQR76161.1 hypothetical protein BXP28_00755 [Paenibacillus larvae subsp. larvae]AQT86178.1 hypothetical protein B1222_19945 [Paenibacillus larvae subsp. pulvifaciens]AQZ47796.1 hypothetical protein B5S25_15620 [Paenibacillus larvae subsp. pulvifaciens]ARF69559.1 hypothetical protein B7C51_19630 [Paenibacillus larvae subsp. pulvifaciens]